MSYTCLLLFVPVVTGEFNNMPPGGYELNLLCSPCLVNKEMMPLSPRLISRRNTELISVLEILLLPEGALVEVPCLVNRNGVQPVRIGPLPAHLSAINLG